MGSMVEACAADSCETVVTSSKLEELLVVICSINNSSLPFKYFKLNIADLLGTGNCK